MPAEKVDEKQGRRRLTLGRKMTVVESAPATPVLEGKGITPGKGRATPSRRRQQEEDEDEGNVLTRTGGGLTEYMAGVRSELDKVAWPEREDTRRLTIVVLAALVASALILGIISAAFTELFRIGLDAPAILFAVMIVAVGAGFFIYRTNSARRASF